MQTLQAKKRIVFGKKTAFLRKSGVLPAIVYGNGRESQALSVGISDFLKIWRLSGESSVIGLSLEGGGTKSVLIHDVTVDSAKGAPLHVDFLEVSADRPIKAHVPLRFVGESPVIKSEGGILVKVMHEIEVEALPKDLPHEIDVDLSVLKQFSNHILIADIILSPKVVAHGDQNAVVAKVVAPRTEEEIAVLKETAAVNLEEIEVEKKGKKDEDAAAEEGSE